jgi:protein-disulfide isomerase
MIRYAKALKVVGIFLLPFLLMSCNKSQQMDKSLINAYENAVTTNLDKGIFPVLGNRKAKVVMHVFFDPLCPACREFDRTVNGILKNPDYKDKLAVYNHLFLLGDDHFPNDTKIGLLTVEMVKRGLFDPYFEQIVNNNLFDYKEILKVAESLTKTSLSDANLAKNSKIIKKEQAVAQMKKLDHTPAIFINNKAIDKTLSEDELKALIDYLNK